jgi:hypothetical protein
VPVTAPRFPALVVLLAVHRYVQSLIQGIIAATAVALYKQGAE